MKRTRFFVRILISLIAIMVVVLCATSLSYGAISKNATGKINVTDGVSLRKSFSTSSKVLTTIPYDTTVTITGETFTVKNSNAKKNKWFKVKYGGKTGYIRSDLIDSISYNKVYGKTTANLSIRKGPSSTFDKIGVIETCKNCYIYLKADYKGQGTWYKVKYNGYYRYVNADYICSRGTSMYNYGVGTVKVGTTNLRESYSADSKVLAKLTKGKKVVLLRQIYTNPNDSSAKYRWYKVKYGKKTGYIRGDMLSAKYYPKTHHANTRINIRKGPSTNYTVVDYYTKNTDVQVYLKTSTVGGNTWYMVRRNNQWRNVFGKYISKGKATEPAEPRDEEKPSEQQDLEKIYNEELAKFPATYKTKLEALHKEHPNWIFKANNIDYTWSEAISKQFADPRVNLYSGGVEAKKAVLEGTYNFSTHTYIGYDSSSWVCASKSAVMFYMDPRNWLTSDGVFMFESFRYDPQTHKESAVKEILKTTGVPESNSKYYMEAAEKYNISPIYLASKTRMELGRGDGKGTSGGTVVYNVFNIGAFDSAGGGAQNGYNYAKQQGWTTYKKAIVGGASYIVDGFMKNNQYSLYYERFNVLNGLSNVATHQYCTNVFNAATMANINYWSYRDIKMLDSNFVFEIPVYKDMPDKPCAEPINGNNNNYLDALSVKTADKKYTLKNDEMQRYGVVNDQDGVNVRKTASSSGTRIGGLSYKETVTIIGSKTSSGWYKVSSSVGTGYVDGKYLNVSYFNRFISKYNVTVPNSVTALTVNYTANLSTAKISVIGNTNLKVGKNTIKVKVVSSSGLIRYYCIYVTRETAAAKISSIQMLMLEDTFEEENHEELSLEDKNALSDENQNTDETDDTDSTGENSDENIGDRNNQVSPGDLDDIEDNDKPAKEDQTLSDSEESLNSDRLQESETEITEPVKLEIISLEELTGVTDIITEDIRRDSHYLTWDDNDNADGYLIRIKSVDEDEYAEINITDMKNYYLLENMDDDKIYSCYVVSYRHNDNDSIFEINKSLSVYIKNYSILNQENGIEADKNN